MKSHHLSVTQCLPLKMGLDCLLYWAVLQSKYFGVKTTNPVKLVDSLSKCGLCGRDRATCQEICDGGGQAQQGMEGIWLPSVIWSRIVVEGMGLSIHQLSMAHFSSSIFIVNDELFVRDAILKKTLSAISIPVIAPTSSSLITFTQQQKEMVLAFSIQSGMNLLWSQK